MTVDVIPYLIMIEYTQIRWSLLQRVLSTLKDFEVSHGFLKPLCHHCMDVMEAFWSYDDVRESTP